MKAPVSTPAISLRHYLVTRLLWSTAPIVVAGVAVHWHLESQLLKRQFDDALVERAMALATLLTWQDGELRLEFADEYAPQYSRAEQPLVFQVWRPDGRVLERSNSLHGADIPFGFGSVTQPANFEMELDSGARYRGIAIGFPARLGAGAGINSEPTPVIAVGGDLRQLQASLREGYTEVAFTGIVSILGILAAILLGSRRAARLLESIAAEVDQITPASLARPIDEQRAPAEIRPIVASLNRSLAVVRSHVEREQRFNADVAHELRTPIAELRAAADVALRWPDEESLRRLAIDARAIAQRMGGLVESLLELATVEAGELHARPEPVDLMKCVRLWVDQANRRAEDGREVVLAESESFTVLSTAGLWELAVNNLLDNALTYSPVSCRIVVSVHGAGPGARVCVSNPTDRLDPEGAARCTERLWRANRNQDESHFGLGLSIVEAACARLGHDLSIRLEAGVFHAIIARFDGTLSNQT